MSNPNDNVSDQGREDRAWDHSSHPEFLEYYAAESENQQTIERFRRQRDVILNLVLQDQGAGKLAVADIGCGAGTLSRLWAEAGHKVSGLDVNGPLIELANQRAAASGLTIDFEVGSATATPWPDASFDICFAPELLEHVADWRSCLNEFSRILRPGGLLFLSTTNSLCPKQQEFRLPLYSWYPPALKRRYERLSLTTRPEIANHAKYPAVNWFTFYGLRRELRIRGFTRFLDRFDIAATRQHGLFKRTVLSVVRLLPPIRFLAHIACEGTTMVAIKAGVRKASSESARGG